MPPNIMGFRNKTKQRAMFVAESDKIDYDYPNGLDLSPQGELHQKLVSNISSYMQESYDVMQARYPSWAKIDRTLTAFIESDDDEDEVQSKDDRRPVSIVLPYSYAVRETILAYLGAAFFTNPLFRYEGTGPEDTYGAMLLELVVQHQARKAKMILNINTWLSDGLSYGLGVMSVKWGPTRRYTGNYLESIDPYYFFPDPKVSIEEIQEGEYVAWLAKTNRTRLKGLDNDGDYFNIGYLDLDMDWRSIYSYDNDARDEKTGISTDSPGQATSRVDNTVIYIQLIPKEWGLGKSEEIETWLFELAGDVVIIRAERVDLDHDMYPIVVNAPEYDGRSIAPISRIEILYGMQHVIDFMFNSHVTNVRKAVNDMLVVDPHMVNIRDVQDPKPGKIIRLKRPAFGRGVKDAVMQLPIQDITRGNIIDAQFASNLMQKVAGTDDAMMGSQRTGGPERLTGTEFQGTRAAGLGRLEHLAQIIGIQGMEDLGYIIAIHTQQFMEDDVYAKITGDWSQRLAEDFGVVPTDTRLAVSPENLDIDFDVEIKDGTIPGGNFSDAYIKMLQYATTSEELNKEVDIFKLFSFVMKGMGAKNVEEFRRNKVGPVSVQPDANIAREAAAGNIVPIRSAG